MAGVAEAKAELFELVQIMKKAEKYKNVRGRLPTGCLLVGPPGTGKTVSYTHLTLPTILLV